MLICKHRQSYYLCNKRNYTKLALEQTMRKILFSVLIIIPVLISCSSGDATSWNSKLIDAYNRTIDDVEDFQDLISLETIGDSIVNSHIINVANLTINNADKSLKQFSTDAPSGGETSRMAFLEMLESVKLQINVGLKFTTYTKETAESDIDKYAEEYDTASLKTAGKASAFEFAQHKFADKIGSETK